jgi:hypothetical protein
VLVVLSSGCDTIPDTPTRQLAPPSESPPKPPPLVGQVPQRISSEVTTLDLGKKWTVVEQAEGTTYLGTWTRRSNNTFDAIWRDVRTNNIRVYTDEITIESIKGFQIVLFRAKFGRYYGTLSADARQISGYRSWNEGTWTATIEGRPTGNAREVPAAGVAPIPQTPVGEMPLEQLLASKDSAAAVAEARNLALLSFKALKLPILLRDKKTAELTALTVQMEQTILDLNRESELEKDRAQRAAGTGSKDVDPLRELSLLYKDRIEVLKPILAAIKEEIANRAK